MLCCLLKGEKTCISLLNVFIASRNTLKMFLVSRILWQPYICIGAVGLNYILFFNRDGFEVRAVSWKGGNKIVFAVFNTRIRLRSFWNSNIFVLFRKRENKVRANETPSERDLIAPSYTFLHINECREYSNAFGWIKHYNFWKSMS